MRLFAKTKRDSQIDKQSLQSAIAALQSRLQALDNERRSILEKIHQLQNQLLQISETVSPLSSNERIALFRNLFKGREDVYPKLWVSKKTGAKGYSPVCEKEWAASICRKPAIRCGECENRKFAPLTDEVVRRHLDGNIVAGVYPLLQNETCNFLACDFDKKNWQDDSRAFMDTCANNNVPAYLERSRSGNGGHVWIFFAAPVAAALARQLGLYLLTETMEQRHQLDMKSYDRLFPNQDTMPKGGFGNLIALPLQRAASEIGNSVFVDENFQPYTDQWSFLQGVKRMTPFDLQLFVDTKLRHRDLMGIRTSQTDDEGQPWEGQANSMRILSPLTCLLPERISVVTANRLYINRDDLPSQLLTRIKRLASFQNPEFFKKQSMRFSTALTPRVICCAEDIKAYLAVPRGCKEDLEQLLSDNGAKLSIEDKRNKGTACSFTFQGTLTEVQNRAIRELLKYDTGVFVAPPGIGKTVIGIRLIAERKTNTLVLVHRKPLLDQWRSRIASFLDIPIDNVGQIGGGKDKATSMIDVAMIQSIARERSVDERIKGYGQIIVDECHHISAVFFERVMMEAKAKYTTGLTATPYRRDGHQPIIIMQCGPVRYKVTSKAAVSDALFTQRLITRATNFSCEWNEGQPITTVWPFLTADHSRNTMICDDVLQNLREQRSPIILTERKEHLELLREMLESHVKHLVILHGGMRAPRRRKMLAKLADLPSDEARLILATGPYIGEGFDDPRLDTLFLTMPFSFKGKMVQYAGRLHRNFEGKKEVRIYDYVDPVPVFEKMFKKRLKAYKALGYEENEK